MDIRGKVAIVGVGHSAQGTLPGKTPEQLSIEAIKSALADAQLSKEQLDSWVETDQAGTVYSYVVYHRAFAAASADEIPYAIGRVKVTAGPTFTVRLDVPLDEITVDMPVVASFKDVTDEISLLQFSKS